MCVVLRGGARGIVNSQWLGGTRVRHSRTIRSVWESLRYLFRHRARARLLRAPAWPRIKTSPRELARSHDPTIISYIQATFTRLSVSVTVAFVLRTQVAMSSQDWGYSVENGEFTCYDRLQSADKHENAKKLTGFVYMVARDGTYYK